MISFDSSQKPEGFGGGMWAVFGRNSASDGARNSFKGPKGADFRLVASKYG